MYYYTYDKMLRDIFFLHLPRMPFTTRVSAQVMTKFVSKHGLGSLGVFEVVFSSVLLMGVLCPPLIIRRL